MNTNFDYLLENKLYETFAQQAIEAEKSLTVSPATCAILSRRALELAVRFVFSYDKDLELPYRDNLSSLIHEQSFRGIIVPRLFPMLKYVVKLGNEAVHTNHGITRDEAIVSLRDLFQFCDWIAYSYDKNYVERFYDESLLADGKEKRVKAEELQKLYEELSSKDQKLEDIRKENKDLLEEMARLRQENSQKRTFRVDKISEDTTRKKYVDLALKEAGWMIGENCTIEEKVYGMPNPTGIGYADYVLWGKDNKPLAVVEAKKASVDPIVGSQQAKLYADCLQNQYGQRPLIFTTNGFDIYYTNDAQGFASRMVSGFFTREELQLEVDRRKQRIPLENIIIKDYITNRPYQKEAVLSVCEAISKKTSENAACPGNRFRKNKGPDKQDCIYSQWRNRSVQGSCPYFYQESGRGDERAYCGYSRLQAGAQSRHGNFSCSLCAVSKGVCRIPGISGQFYHIRHL